LFSWSESVVPLWMLLPVGYIVSILYDVKEFMLSLCLYPRRPRLIQGCRANDDDDDMSIPMSKGDVIEAQMWLCYSSDQITAS
jgi:hypothetical protein